MKRLLALALTAGVAVAAISPVTLSPAAAADGCGRGFHAGPRGRCLPNRGHGPGPAVVAPGLVIGNFYAGRGYWDGHRYYQHRERYRGGYRYR